MPTISQLPSATAPSAADEVPISQGGTARAISIGALLASTQPAIIVTSPSLLGRTSLGPGGPEEISLGVGISISEGTLTPDGLDHSTFPLLTTISSEPDLVVSDQGNPMLMQASLLRGLFSAGENVAIDTNGVISATALGTTAGVANAIADLHLVTSLASQDLVAASHAGSDCAIAYNNLLSGVTIDQTIPAGPAAASDTILVAQGSNILVCQTFSAIWRWIAGQLPTYQAPTVEITTNTTLNASVHNSHILICSLAVTLTPAITEMGSGFQCVVINASSGNVALGAGFVSSTGSLLLTPWQSATLSCFSYSAGSVAFAAMPTVA